MRFKRLKKLLGLEREYMVVFCHDSPGMRVLVHRNQWDRLFYPIIFSAIGERQVPTCEFPGTEQDYQKLNDEFESSRMLSNIHGW